MSAWSRLALEFTKDLFVDAEEVRIRAQVIADRYATWLLVAGASSLALGYQVGRSVDRLSRLVGRLTR